jgi:hypothetical protein
MWQTSESSKLNSIGTSLRNPIQTQQNAHRELCDNATKTLRISMEFVFNVPEIDCKCEEVKVHEVSYAAPAINGPLDSDVVDLHLIFEACPSLGLIPPCLLSHRHTPSNKQKCPATLDEWIVFKNQ